MRAIAVDDELNTLEALVKEIKKVPQITSVVSFNDGYKALEYVGINDVDIAFLDIQMQLHGIALAKKIGEISPKTNIVFVTAFTDYAIDAFDVKASDYLLKPVRKDDIFNALQKLRNPVLQKNCPFYVQCFGNFEVFKKGVPVQFARAKTKELFAYLISKKGATCTNNEIIAALWENRPDSDSLQSQFRHLVSDLIKMLKDADLQHAVLHKRGNIAIVPDEIKCDFFDYLKGLPGAKQAYTGDFMLQYSWAEPVKPN